MKRRITSEDEKTLFRKSVERANPRVLTKPKPEKSPAKAAPPGLDGATSARLKRGAESARGQA